MIVGIDASSLRAGGGITHLSNLLEVASPEPYGITRVVVWGGRDTLDRLPARTWLVPAHERLLDGNLASRLSWQLVRLPWLATRQCDLLFAPGGTSMAPIHPRVVMSRNMLPFDVRERRRFGVSWTRARLGLLKRSQSRSFRSADGVIFLTEYAQREVCAQLRTPPHQVAIVPHGVDERFRCAPRPQRRLATYDHSHPFRLLYVSIVTSYKHQWVVAEAVAALRQAGLPVAIDFVGPNGDPRAVQQLSDAVRRLDPAGAFLNVSGPCAYRDLPARYQAADAFVFASSCENMPNILIEAMASGLPIACSNRGPMPEVLGPGGVPFDPEDAADVEASLRRLLNDPDVRASVATHAYERSKAFTWERCARDTFAFLARVEAHHRRGRA